MKKSLLYANLLAIVLIFFLYLTKFFSQKQINLSEKKYYNEQLTDLLTNINYNNNLLESGVLVSNENHLKYLGKKKPVYLYIAKFDNIPKAIIIPVTAPNGYNGNIDLLIAININKNINKNINNKNIYNIIKIKTIHHQETPGLGDFIDNSKTSWLNQFQYSFLNKFWGLKKDDKNNQFDSVTGATITSRAVTIAVKNSLILLDLYPELPETPLETLLEKPKKQNNTI